MHESDVWFATTRRAEPEHPGRHELTGELGGGRILLARRHVLAAPG